MPEGLQPDTIFATVKLTVYSAAMKVKNMKHVHFTEWVKFSPTSWSWEVVMPANRALENSAWASNPTMIHHNIATH